MTHQGGEAAEARDQAEAVGAAVAGVKAVDLDRLLQAVSEDGAGDVVRRRGVERGAVTEEGGVAGVGERDVDKVRLVNRG